MANLLAQEKEKVEGQPGKSYNLPVGSGKQRCVVCVYICVCLCVHRVCIYIHPQTTARPLHGSTAVVCGGHPPCTEEGRGAEGGAEMSAT